MSGREWKPGDVAIATVRGRVDVLVMRRESTCEQEWATPHGVAGWWLHDEHRVTDVRPLAVIDPEDREQVERLARLTSDVPAELAISSTRIERMAVALREFAAPKPPRIDEPGTWGVVRAEPVNNCGPFTEWVRNLDGLWYAVGESDAYEWDGLHDPELVREGVPS